VSALISIVITSYNREAYLGAAIESVLAQTWQDFELLVWDDGSTDNSLAIARQYAEKDSRIRVVASHHRGSSAILKDALAETKGTYLGCVDSDDAIAPTTLAETAAILTAHPEVGFVYTDYYDTDAEAKILGYGQRCHIPYSPDRLLLDFMTFHFRLIRRSVYEQIEGLNESLRVVDYDLCLRLSEVAKVYHLPKPLYFYRNHQQSISQQERIKQAQDSQKIIAQALQRRGKAKHWRIDLEIERQEQHIHTRFFLRPRNSFAELAQKIAATALTTLSLNTFALAPAQAQITPANDGTGTTISNPSSNPNQINIGGGTTSGSNLFHSFQEFGLNSSQIANFLSNPNIQNILGRVTGGNASVINGLIQVTGGNSNLYLMNPAGIIFGANSSLNVPASFTATTATGIGFGNNWFNAFGSNNYAALSTTPSNFAFNLSNPGSIVNAGNLAVPTGQNLSLIAGNVVNTGTLTSPGGNITIAAVPGSSLVKISQPGNILSLEINLQDTSVTAGINPLTLPQLLTGKENLTTGVTVNNTGQAVLTNGTLIADGGSAITAGNLNTASNQIGGKVQVLGNTVKLINANINANGNLGGGTVLIGGDYQGKGTVPTAQTTVIDKDSVIHADALTSGNGGQVIAWADDSTYFQGKITARGGLTSGNGGFIETSGKQNLSVAGASVDALAPQGLAGNWLLDPQNIIVQAGGSATLADVSNAGDTTNNFTIDPNTINSATANVILAASDSITVNNPITLSNAGVGLTANAGGDINLNASITTNSGNINFNNSGVFSLSNGATLNTSGTGNITLRQNVPGKIQAVVDAIGSLGTGTATINLGAGTFTDINAEVVSVVGKRLTIKGIGSGTDATTNTIVDGENSRRGFYLSGGANVSLDNLRVVNGSVSNFKDGGGIYVDAGTTLNLSNSIVADNSADGGGGGIFNQGTANISNSTLSSNYAGGGYGGGGISNAFGGTANISNSTLSSNSAFLGGGISNALGSLGSTVNISNSTLSSNYAGGGYGGGIYNNFATTNISNSTLSSNSADYGGGIYNYFDTINIGNSIVAGNTASSGAEVYQDKGTFSSQGNNLVGQNGNAGGFPTISTDIILNTTADKVLAPLGNYGGITQTRALLPGSLAIDAGNNGLIPTSVTTDQRGGSRIVNGTVDIGAVEFQGYNITPLAGAGQSTTVNTAFSTALQAKVVENLFNNPLAGINVSFSTPSTGASGSFSNNTVTTDAAGIATASTLTANTQAGTYQASANSGNLNANFNLTNNPDVASIISILGGNNQSTVVAKNFTTNLQVKITDQYNNPIPNATVSFAAPSSGASANFSSNSSLTTDSNGIATASNLTANTQAGSYQVTANSGNLNANFNLTNNPDVASIISIMGGNNQSTVVAKNFTTNLQVKITDQYNNPIPNATVSFAAPSSGASANFSSNSSLTTDSNGIATASNLTANTQAGSYQATANSGNLNANFNLTNNPAPTLPPIPVAIAPTPTPELIAPPEYENVHRQQQLLPSLTEIEQIAFFYTNDEALNVLDSLLPKVVDYMNQDGGTLSVNLGELVPIPRQNLLLTSENQIVIRQNLIGRVQQLIGAEFVEFVTVDFNNERDNTQLIVKVKKSPNRAVLKK
jgi:filamentous hemagglutinin family protein